MDGYNAEDKHAEFMRLYELDFDDNPDHVSDADLKKFRAIHVPLFEAIAHQNMDYDTYLTHGRKAYVQILKSVDVSSELTFSDTFDGSGLLFWGIGIFAAFGVVIKEDEEE